MTAISWKGVSGVVRIGNVPWTDRSLIDSERYFSRGMQGRRPGIGRVGALIQGLIQYQEAPNSQLRAEFLPSLVSE